MNINKEKQLYGMNYFLILIISIVTLLFMTLMQMIMEHFLTAFSLRVYLFKYFQSLIFFPVKTSPIH
jgi:hypothetical protein